MNNGITEQLRGLKREKRRLEQLLSGTIGWYAYQELVAAQPDRTEKDIVREGLPKLLARELHENRLFQARLKIIDAIDLLTNLVNDTHVVSDQASLPQELEIEHLRWKEEMQGVQNETAFLTELIDDGHEVEPSESQTTVTAGERLSNETPIEVSDDFGPASNATIEVSSVYSRFTKGAKHFRTENASSGADATGCDQYDQGQPEVDDLTRIDGIDRGIALQLRSQGVKTFADIAGWTPATLAVISSMLELDSLPREQNWIGQAARLCKSDAAAPPISEEPQSLDKLDLASDVVRQADNPPENSELIVVEACDTPPRGVDNLAISVLPLLALGGAGGMSQHTAATQIIGHQRKTHFSDAAGDAKERIDAIVGQSNTPLQFTATVEEPISNSVVAEPVLAETAVNDATPDDLLRIKGLTDADFEIFLKLGFTSFAALAAASAHDVKYLKASLSDGGRLHKEQWIEQAAMLAQGKLTCFAERQICKIIPTTVAMPIEQHWEPQLPAQSKEFKINAHPTELVIEVISQEDKGVAKKKSFENLGLEKTSVEDQAISIAKIDTQEDNVVGVSEDTSTDRDGIALSSDSHLAMSSEDETMPTHATQSKNFGVVLSDGENFDLVEREIEKSDRLQQPSLTTARDTILHDKVLSQPSPVVHNPVGPATDIAETQEPRIIKYDTRPQEQITEDVNNRKAITSNLQGRLDAAEVDVDDARVDISHNVAGQEPAVEKRRHATPPALPAQAGSADKTARYAQDLAMRLKRHAPGRDKKRYPIARYAFAAEEASVQIIRRDAGASVNKNGNEKSAASKEKSNPNPLSGRFLGVLTGRDKK